MSFFKKDLNDLCLEKTDLKIKIMEDNNSEPIDEEELDTVFSLLYVKNILEEDTYKITDNQFKGEKNKEIDKVHVPVLLSEKRKNTVLDTIKDVQHMNKQKMALFQNDNSFNPLVIFIKVATPYFLATCILYKYGALICFLNVILISALLSSSDDLIAFLNKDLPEEELDVVGTKFLLDSKLFISVFSISFFVSLFYNTIAILIVFVILFIIAAILGNVIKYRCIMLCNVYDQVLEFVKNNLNKEADV